MRSAIIASAAAWLLAALVAQAAAQTASDCDAAATRIASQGAVPAPLLHAIEQVESAGQPWAVNVDGQGRSFAAKRQAIDYVRQALASGARFVDVGCFQVDLHFHPDAFADLDAAFDPALNAAYAARLLVSLRGGNLGWDDAVATYHSADPRLGWPYRDRVLGWARDGLRPNKGARAPRLYAGVLVIGPGMAAAVGRNLPAVFVP